MKSPKPWNHPDRVALFWSRVEKDPESDCLLFKGALDRGWGRLKIPGFPGAPGRAIKAHRYAYALEHGPIPPGVDIHHDHDICAHRNCVNLDHLAPIDHDTHGVVSQSHRRGAEFNPWENTVNALDPIL